MQTRSLEKAVCDDAEGILEKVMKRRNWSHDVRDELAAALLRLVRLSGGKYRTDADGRLFEKKAEEAS